jgi:hypothetical protein
VQDRARLVDVGHLDGRAEENLAPVVATSIFY